MAHSEEPTTRRARSRVAAGVGLILVLVVAAIAVTASRRSDSAADDVATAEATSTTSGTPATRRPTTSAVAPTTTQTATTTTTAAPSPTTRATGSTTSPTTAAPRPPTTNGPATAAPPTTPPPPPPPPPGPGLPGPGRSLDAYRGLGIWLDVLDWSPTYTGGASRFDAGDVDWVADLGVQTIYIQTSRFNRSEDILDESLLRSIIDRAHARGLRVVGWYLPTLVDPATDLRRLVAMTGLGVDGVGVDIEDRSVTDVAERNSRLLQLTADLRAWLPDHPLAAVVLPPVVTEILNTAYWPGLPWAELANSYDVWMPMGYWTNRTPESGWRDGYRYTAENIDLLRSLTGRGDLPVHPVGGIADQIYAADVDAMAAAVADRGALGGSLYDLRTTRDDVWGSLSALRR